MNEVVMYNNDLNTLILPESFTDAELRVFFAVVSRLRDKGSTEVTFSYSYLREITKEKKHYTKSQYSALIQSIYRKIIGLRFAYQNEEAVGEVNLFQSYERSLSDESFTISVSPKFQYIFNELSVNGSFTAWSLGEFCDVPGVYAKQLYRLLKQWKYVGSASFVLTELRKYMGVPEGYQTRDVTRRVIEPSVKKLSETIPEFKGLKFEYSNIKNKAYRVRFSWAPEKRISKEMADIMKKEKKDKTLVVSRKKEPKVDKYGRVSMTDYINMLIEQSVSDIPENIEENKVVDTDNEEKVLTLEEFKKWDNERKKKKENNDENKEDTNVSWTLGDFNF